MSSKITDEDITELCKAIEVYQAELSKAENEIKQLNRKLEESTEKMKLYEELEETIVQLDQELTTSKFTLGQKIEECNELQKENMELQSLIKTTTDCLEELHQSKKAQQQSLENEQYSSNDYETLRKQLEATEAIKIEQEKQIKKYEIKMKKMQDSIDQLRNENESLASKAPSMEGKINSGDSSSSHSIRANSPVNLVPRNKPGGGIEGTLNSFQRKTPPRSARRLMQSSSTDYGENKFQPESPRRAVGTNSGYGRGAGGGYGSGGGGGGGGVGGVGGGGSGLNETRRHSSYTTGDYVVSYAMRQNGELSKKSQADNSEDLDPPVVAIAVTPKKGGSFQELSTHPYYPHSPAASSLWQETIATQKPYDPLAESVAIRENRKMELKARRSRHSFEDRTVDRIPSRHTAEKVESPDQNSQDHLYSPIDGTPRSNTSPTQPQFTQPRILYQTQISAITSDNPSYPQNSKFTVKRNLDEEEEGRTITSTRWKMKGLNSTKIVPIRLPASPTNTSHKTLSTTSSQEITITTRNGVTNPSESEHQTRGFYRYNGNNPANQQNLMSSSVPNGKSQWQNARIQLPNDPCLSLAQLPSDPKLTHLSPKTRACSESSDEYTKNRHETFDDSDHDRDLEVIRRGDGDEDDNDEDDCDDDSSVKVELGGYTSTSTKTNSRRIQSGRTQNNHRFIDLGNITLDCD